MQLANVSGILVEKTLIESKLLNRQVKVDLYLPNHIADPSAMSLLLINDGQQMEEMGFSSILEKLYNEGAITPLLCAAIHAGPERKREYGVASQPDYKGRGDRAGLYQSFIFEELLPYLRSTYNVPSFKEKAFAGFSLGGLSAMDIVWNHPAEFSKVGVFSGSFWWRDKDTTAIDYSDKKNRIIQNKISSSRKKPKLKYWFYAGGQEENSDRDKDGISDVVDDTKDLIEIIKNKNVCPPHDIIFRESTEGKHEYTSWRKAFPEFLTWAFER